MGKKFIAILLIFPSVLWIASRGISVSKADYCNCRVNYIGQTGQLLGTGTTWTWTPFGCLLWGLFSSPDTIDGQLVDIISPCCCWNSAPYECWDGSGEACRAPGNPQNKRKKSGGVGEPVARETAGKNVPPERLRDPNPVPPEELQKMQKK